MIEISGDHVKKLNDADLRQLVVRLCEAELRSKNLPVSAITAGGNQDAADGGIDVRVTLPDCTTRLDFIPNRFTGYQIKCTDMPASKVQEEMRPHGELRESIRNLATTGGAYVIVSSQGSLSDSALEDRRNAMRTAISDYPDAGNLYLDFYDRERIASWIRGFPGVEMWFRERIQEPLSGWATYGLWAHGDKKGSKFLFDDRSRIISARQNEGKSVSIQQGIASLRSILRTPGGIVRLVGLSGLGKTRLVQALFETEVGTDALDSSIALYTDQGSQPTPSARDMLARLGANGLRAIVVVDNCNPETHSVLANLTELYKETLSLITVEYDVVEDDIESTEVFRLEPISDEVLTNILRSLAPHVGQTDRARIAEFSGGNARISLALARTISHAESVGSLNDTQLFKRLFHQRQTSGEALMRAAEACALVYSFDAETLTGDAAEIPTLAEQAGLSTKELHRYLADLRDRDVIQSRGQWRAILPPAIANRLATQALNRLQKDDLVDSFTKTGRERLLRSFSRRLGYLHHARPAQDIARALLGRYHPLSSLPQRSVEIIQNIAPVIPEDILEKIETAIVEEGSQFLSTKNRFRQNWIRLLRAIAYDSENFSKAAELIATFCASEDKYGAENSARHSFYELFHIVLSGTRSPLSQRLNLVRTLFASGDPHLNQIALEAVGETLKSSYFSSSHEFTFGARPRDFGWLPANISDQQNWYREALQFSKEVLRGYPEHTATLKKTIGANFRFLFLVPGISDELADFAKEISTANGWPDGWKAVRQSIKYDSKGMPLDLITTLRSLEKLLAPQDTLQKVRAYVFSNDIDFLKLENESGHPKLKDLHSIIEELGIEVASQPNLLTAIAPDLYKDDGHQWPFGRGLALGAADLREMWNALVESYSLSSFKGKNCQVLRGFVSAAHEIDQAFCEEILDSSSQDKRIANQFVLLQSSIPIDKAGAERLIAALSDVSIPLWTYENLCFGGVADHIPVESLRRLLLGIVANDGFSIAAHILSMRIFANSEEIDEGLLLLCREFLTHATFHSKDSNLSHRLNEIAKLCLAGPEAEIATRQFCEKLNHGLEESFSSVWSAGALFSTIFELQPAIALDAFFDKPHRRMHQMVSFPISGEGSSNALHRFPTDILWTWARRDPQRRWKIISQQIQIVESTNEGQELKFTELGWELLTRAPNQAEVLAEYSSRLTPSSWSGSRSLALEPYVKFFESVALNSEQAIALWANQEARRVRQEIASEQAAERQKDYRFE